MFFRLYLALQCGTEMSWLTLRCAVFRNYIHDEVIEELAPVPFSEMPYPIPFVKEEEKIFLQELGYFDLFHPTFKSGSLFDSRGL